MVPMALGHHRRDRPDAAERFRPRHDRAPRTRRAISASGEVLRVRCSGCLDRLCLCAVGLQCADGAAREPARLHPDSEALPSRDALPPLQREAGFEAASRPLLRDRGRPAGRSRAATPPRRERCGHPGTGEAARRPEHAARNGLSGSPISPRSGSRQGIRKVRSAGCSAASGAATGSCFRRACPRWRGPSRS
jgi:hypothetical protein